METPPGNSHKIILAIMGVIVLGMGVALFFIPPALFTDPSQGFQVLQSMQHGSGFNNLVSPDQGDFSQNYTQFLTWWSPGQYLAPYCFQRITGLDLAHGIVITTVLAEFLGLAGLFYFFRKIGFTPVVASVSLLFIVSQVVFMVPHVYYSGGEILLFAFEGWFLYGCVALKRADWKLFLFVLLSGFVGFFLKSSFLWIYGGGLLCLWIGLCQGNRQWAKWIKNGFWVGLPAAIAVVVIYHFYIAKGDSPITGATGLKLTAETFSYPLASPVLAGFSLDDMLNGLVDHFGKPLFSQQWALIILIAAALLSVVLVWLIVRGIPNKNYRLFVMVFYAAAVLFFGVSYLRQLNISMEARHFRIIGLLVTPGVIYLAAHVKTGYKVLFALIFLWIAGYSLSYLVNGYKTNRKLARGITGIAQPNIDQAALNQVLKLDREKRGITFVFIGDDIGLELQHNRYLSLPPVPDSLKISTDDYEYDGFGGPLYIILPETYNGPKEKLVMKSFPNYAGWNVSMIDKYFVLYVADRKK
ncbi:MAG TPA: hypothetical protein VFE53_02535 [Mucilaginibacter sp.]|jgi:hypothetical protein|nr:hypothetical protein [Mucilaginibacter sp.]